MTKRASLSSKRWAVPMRSSSMFYFNISINCRYGRSNRPAPLLRGLQVQPGLLIARAPSRARTRGSRWERERRSRGAGFAPSPLRFRVPRLLAFSPRRESPPSFARASW